jgi:DNA-binding HxlR family transcriptional regulator
MTSLVAETVEENLKVSPRAKMCPVGMDLAALGKKWTFHILYSIGLSNIDRFNQILRSLPGLTPRVLIMRLNELEACGLIQPLLIQTSPRLVRWKLTSKGEDTLPIIKGYSSYVAKWHPNSSLKNHLPQPAKYPSIQELIDLQKQSRAT